MCDISPSLNALVERCKRHPSTKITVLSNLNALVGCSITYTNNVTSYYYLMWFEAKVFSMPIMTWMMYKNTTRLKHL
jgi:hypothetical protein